MKFTAIVVSHANQIGLGAILDDLQTQTRPSDEIVVLCSDTPDVEELREDYREATFVERENENDWGHGKRAAGIRLATGDWIGFFNDDDSYDERYLETMLSRATDDVDVVFCAWNEQPNCDFARGRSTAGNFVVRAELAKRVGWTERIYEADGVFIDALVAAGARVVKVEEILYFHNAQ